MQPYALRDDEVLRMSKRVSKMVGVLEILFLEDITKDDKQLVGKTT